MCSKICFLKISVNSFAHFTVFVVTRRKEPKFFLDSQGRFFSSGLVFSISACKILNKVLIYQSFSNSGVPPQPTGYDPGNRYSYAVFIGSGGGRRKIFSLFYVGLCKKVLRSTLMYSTYLTYQQCFQHKDS